MDDRPAARRALGIGGWSAAAGTVLLFVSIGVVLGGDEVYQACGGMGGLLWVLAAALVLVVGVALGIAAIWWRAARHIVAGLVVGVLVSLVVAPVSSAIAVQLDNDPPRDWCGS